MTRRLICAGMLLHTFALLPPAFAVTNFNLLVTQPSYSGCGDPAYAWIDEGTCADLTSDPLAGLAFVWVVVSETDAFPDGIGGAQFGITYTADVTGWNLCNGGLEISEEGWPASGHGTAVTWGGACYRPAGGNARIGYFTVSDGAAGIMQITGDPRLGKALYTNCNQTSYDVCEALLGSADLSVGVTPVCGDDLVTLPTPATDCQATDDRCPIEVTWTHDGADVEGFRVLRNGVPITATEAEARSYIDYDAEPRWEYDYAVVAFNHCGGADPSDPDVGTIPPVASAWGVAATVDVCEYVRVTWTDNSDNETGFIVFNQSTPLATVGPDVTEYIHATAWPGRYYRYHVVAFNDCGPAWDSPTAVGRRPPVPESASDCVASDDRCMVVRVTWRDNSIDETGFTVLRDDVAIGTVASDTEQFDDSLAVPGVTYSYRVVAMNGCGDSDSSAPDLGQRPDGPPATATNLEASDHLCHLVRLRWQDNTPDETGFKVLRDGEPIATTLPDAIGYDDSTAVTGVTYAYSVVTTNECGDANPSDPDDGGAGLAPPPAAAGCLATDSLCDAVRVFWTDTSEDEVGFKILRDGLEIAITGPDVIQFDDQTGVGDQVYEYSVVATNDCGDAVASNVDTGVRPEPLEPTAPVLLAPDDDATCVPLEVTFRWRSVPDAIAYVWEIDYECGGGGWQVRLPDTTYTATLAAGQLYHWRVRTENVCETGDPSPCRRVTPGPTLPAPVLEYEPTDTNYVYYAFWWTPIDAAEHYTLNIGNCYYINEDTDQFTVVAADTVLDMTPYWSDHYGSAQFEGWVTAFGCGDDSDDSNCVGGYDVPVLLESFDAFTTTAAIVVEWQTRREWGVRGFNLWRTIHPGQAFEVVNSALIPTGGPLYRYEDDSVVDGLTYLYRLTEVTGEGAENVLGVITATAAVTAPATAFFQNKPNPFNPTTTMLFELSEPTHVVLDIFDASGRAVRRLLAGPREAGSHRVVWDGRDDAGRALGSGAYYARFRANGFEGTRRLVLLR